MENEPYFSRDEQKRAVRLKLSEVVDFLPVADFLCSGGTFTVSWEKGRKRPTVAFGKRAEKKA